MYLLKVLETLNNPEEIEKAIKGFLKSHNEFEVKNRSLDLGEINKQIAISQICSPKGTVITTIIITVK